MATTILAEKLLQESQGTLAAADQKYAAGYSGLGDAALRITYALGDTAVALVPFAALAATPAAVALIVGLEALNIVKSWYEYRTGERIWNKEALSPFQKDMALLNVAVGFLPAAVEIGATSVKTLKAAITYTEELLSFGRSAEEAAAVSASAANSSNMVEVIQNAGINEREVVRVLDSAGGSRLIKSRQSGFDVLPDGSYNVFDRSSKINNPLPADGTYAKAIERSFAEDIKNGTGRLAGKSSNEGWITAAEDLRDTKRWELAKRLGLYQDKAGTVLKNTDDYVVVEFKLKDPTGPGISTPIDPTGTKRAFGWIPGGKTIGGAREWLINADAPNLGYIDLSTTKIRELAP